jgi:hypothetical protein
MLPIRRRGLFALTFLSLFSTGRAPAKARARSFANVAELREFVMAVFRTQPGVDAVTADPGDPAKFRIMMGQWSSTGDVTNIFGHINAYPDEAEKTVDTFIRSMSGIVEGVGQAELGSGTPARFARGVGDADQAERPGLRCECRQVDGAPAMA